MTEAGISRVDVWAVPTADVWGPAWRVLIGVHTLGRYTESPASVPLLPERDALAVCRRLSGEVDPGGETYTLRMDPRPESLLP